MRILQPAEWSKPRGFSHGVEVDGPGKWIVLAGQTGGDEKGDYQPDMAAQVGTALKRIIKLLGEAGAGPEHIVRLTWYLTSRSEYEAAGAGIGAAWKETLGRNFPPSTLLYIDGLVDVRAKVEIEVTAYVPEGVKRASTRQKSKRKSRSMTNRSTSADFVTAFATGWPEQQPDIMVLSLTTHKGVQDFAFNKEQALLIAKTIKETAAKLAKAQDELANDERARPSRNA